jgi:hypothetical protein
MNCHGPEARTRQLSLKNTGGNPARIVPNSIGLCPQTPGIYRFRAAGISVIRNSGLAVPEAPMR